MLYCQYFMDNKPYKLFSVKLIFYLIFLVIGYNNIKLEFNKS